MIGWQDSKEADAIDWDQTTWIICVILSYANASTSLGLRFQHL